MKALSTKPRRLLKLRFLLAPMLLVFGQNCTNLTEVPHDALTPATAFKTDAEILAGVAGVYASLRDIEDVAPQELSTPGLIVPTRGSDWYDNGQWLDMHRQTWTANSAGTQGFLDGEWNSLFSGVAKSNLMIDVITKSGLAQARKDSTLAELRTMRAWYYYMLQDLFGGVPLSTTTELAQVARVTRDSVFRFLQAELLASRGNLPDKWDAGNYGRVTKGAANAILASLYINAGVFDKNTGVNATSYNSCSGVAVTGGDACTEAIAAADAVINSGQYTLSANWADNFSPTNQGSKENIFVIVHVNTTTGIGGNWPMRTLHYNQLSTGWGSPWNGYATTAETYNAFDAADDRLGMWLVGRQKSFETGQFVNDRAGNPLIFTALIADVTKAGEGVGARFNKFSPIPSPLTGNGQPNSFTFFRLAEMYLIKAEALLESGQAGAAQVQFNIIHNLHDAANPAIVSRAAILNERTLELSAEGKRRTDMIRNGTFLSWTEASLNGHVDKSAEAFRLLYPISSNQLASNSLLKQNPGY
jgi:starch-binding outer membrane protein, SusD/RagB family